MFRLAETDERARTVSYQIIIDRRYCGPKDSANGGYVCGLIAQHIDGVAEVTLRKPPPLERALALERNGESLRLTDADNLVAEARSGTLNIDRPEPSSFEVASGATKSDRGFESHALPYCYVCGPLREDGMHIYPSPIADREIVASPWIPENYQAGADGRIRPEFQWAALDCPGFFAIDSHATRLLGRLTARLEGSVRVAENVSRSAGTSIATGGNTPRAPPCSQNPEISAVRHWQHGLN